MGNPPRYGGLDAFKVIAALLVVAIHTSPLTTYSPENRRDPCEHDDHGRLHER